MCVCVCVCVCLDWSHLARVLEVTLFEERDVEAPGVGAELLHSARPEGVTRRDHDLDPVLLEIVAHL